MLSFYHILHLAAMIKIILCNPFNDLDVNFLSNIRLLDEDPFETFNKTLASKSTSTIRNYGAYRTPRTPPTVPVPYTPQFILQPTSVPDGKEILSYAPPSRTSFTPPLPREYFSPFADKPTLRGSNSDNTIPNRRPIPPPPFAKNPSEKERIPIKPPDLMVPDTKKKSINTPSIQKLPDSVLNYSEPSSSPTSTTHRINDTFDIVIPMVHNISSPSILRILDNGKKHDFLGNKPRLEQEIKTKTFKDDILKNLSPTTTIKSTSIPVVSKDEDSSKELSQFVFPQNNVIDMSVNQDNAVKEQQITEGKSEYHPPVKSIQQSTDLTSLDRPEPRIRYILGIAWDIHVYLIGTLFAVLACVSAFSLCRIRAYKWLLPCGYFITIHCLLIAIGIDRSVYLFYDAYNIGKSFSEPVSRFLLNMVFPFLIALFTVMFAFILKTIDIKTCYYYIQKTYALIGFMFIYVVFSILNDLYAHMTLYFSMLLLLSQCMYIVLCVILGTTYIYMYKHLSHASLRKPNSVYGTPYADPLRPSLAHALRVMLATSLLSLLMASIQSIGLFCIYEPFGKDQPHPWLWWAFQLSVRVIEISMCFLILWAAVQPSYSDEKETHSHNSASGFALFSWGTNTPRGSDNGNADDIYPTMCNSGQEIHNYSLRSRKQVYEDVFPLNNVHHPGSAVPTHLISHTTERRSVKRYPPDTDISRSTCGTMYVDRRPHPSPSMLVDEKGIVRFRSFNDSEPQPEELFVRGHLVHPIEEYST